MKKWEKLQMGDMETDTVIYQGTNLVAHRRLKLTHQPQFTLAELKEIVRRWNAYEDILKALENFVDNEVCQFDHHGYCQTHSLTQPYRVQTARDIIGRNKETE